MDFEPEKPIRIVLTLTQLDYLRRAQMYLWRLRPEGKMPGYDDTIGWLAESFCHSVEESEKCEHGVGQAS